MDYTGKVALVTGAGSGIGRAMSERLAAKGAAVVLVDIDKAGLQETEQQIKDRGGECVLAAANVADQQQLEAAFQVAGSLDGSFQLLCNNAGIATKPGYLEDLVAPTPRSGGGWRATVDVNFVAVMAGTELGVKAMRQQGGVIINVASVAGLEPYPDVIYAATKAGVINFTRSLVGLPALGINVRVNCLCPASIDTPLMRRPFEEMGDAGKAILDSMQLIPPERCADGMETLINDESLVGRALIVDPEGERLVEFPPLYPALRALMPT